MSISEFGFVTLDQVKNFMGMSGSDSTTDDLIENLISRVSVLMETFMGRNILSREYTEVHNGGGVYVLFPKQGNITLVTSIHDSYDWDWDDDALIDSDDYRITDSDYITLKGSVSPFSNYTNNIQIIYTAGYSSVPLDIAQACITEVSRMYKNKNSVDINSKTLSDGSISFYDKGLLPITLLTLDKYKRRTVV